MYFHYSIPVSMSIIVLFEYVFFSPFFKRLLEFVQILTIFEQHTNDSYNVDCNKYMYYVTEINCFP